MMTEDYEKMNKDQLSKHLQDELNKHNYEINYYKIKCNEYLQELPVTTINMLLNKDILLYHDKKLVKNSKKKNEEIKGISSCYTNIKDFKEDADIIQKKLGTETSDYSDEKLYNCFQKERYGVQDDSMDTDYRDVLKKYIYGIIKARLQIQKQVLQKKTNNMKPIFQIIKDFQNILKDKNTLKEKLEKIENQIENLENHQKNVTIEVEREIIQEKLTELNIEKNEIDEGLEELEFNYQQSIDNYEKAEEYEKDFSFTVSREALLKLINFYSEDVKELKRGLEFFEDTRMKFGTKLNKIHAIFDKNIHNIPEIEIDEKTKDKKTVKEAFKGIHNAYERIYKPGMERFSHQYEKVVENFEIILKIKDELETGKNSSYVISGADSIGKYVSLYELLQNNFGYFLMYTSNTFTNETGIFENVNIEDTVERTDDSFETLYFELKKKVNLSRIVERHFQGKDDERINEEMNSSFLEIESQQQPSSFMETESEKPTDFMQQEYYDPFTNEDEGDSREIRKAGSLGKQKNLQKEMGYLTEVFSNIMKDGKEGKLNDVLDQWDSVKRKSGYLNKNDIFSILKKEDQTGTTFGLSEDLTKDEVDYSELYAEQAKHNATIFHKKSIDGTTTTLTEQKIPYWIAYINEKLLQNRMIRLDDREALFIKNSMHADILGERAIRVNNIRKSPLFPLYMMMWLYETRPSHKDSLIKEVQKRPMCYAHDCDMIALYYYSQKAFKRIMYRRRIIKSTPSISIEEYLKQEGLGALDKGGKAAIAKNINIATSVTFGTVKDAHYENLAGELHKQIKNAAAWRSGRFAYQAVQALFKVGCVIGGVVAFGR